MADPTPDPALVELVANAIRDAPVSIRNGYVDSSDVYSAEARAVEGDGSWDVPSTGVVQLGGVDDLDGLVMAPRNVAHHIARHDPARVLREVEAKREIVNCCERYAEDGCTSGADLALTVLPRCWPCRMPATRITGRSGGHDPPRVTPRLRGTDMTDPRAELHRMIAEKIDAKMHSERMDDHFDGQDYANAVMELLETVSFDDGPRILIWTHRFTTANIDTKSSPAEPS